MRGFRKRPTQLPAERYSDDGQPCHPAHELHADDERFDMNEVPDYDAMTEYRPTTLANHLDFKDAYGAPGAKSDPERDSVAAFIEERLPPNLSF